MKILLILLFFYSSAPWAKTNELIRCLAKEEARFHASKIQDANYALNQSFINEFASNNDIHLKEQFIEEICSKKSMSLYFLELLLTKETEIFNLNVIKNGTQMSGFKLSHIEEFQKEIPHLFMNYLSTIRLELNDPYCLNKLIPEIHYFEERMKYLEEEISIQQVFNDKKKIRKIFIRLYNFNELKKSCENLKLSKKKKTKKS